MMFKEEKELVVSTITWARTSEEEQTILKAISTLSELGIVPIIAVDGGSSVEFIESLSEVEGVQVIRSHEESLLGQVRESLRIASDTGSPFIFYTEANKLDFFRLKAGLFTARAMELIRKDPNCGVILASRNNESLSTFPPFQQFTEGMINQLLSKILRRDGGEDFAYGPRIIFSDLIPSLDRLKIDVGWGWMSYILVKAQQMGKSIHSISMDLPCPIGERKEDEGDRFFRLNQLRDHVVAISEAVRN